MILAIFASAVVFPAIAAHGSVRALASERDPQLQVEPETPVQRVQRGELASAPLALESEAAELIKRWAPNFSQAASPDRPERDRPLAVDFDGDWDATNNWRNLGAHHQSSPVTVYASAVLTHTHGYLTYTLFYPRDWFAPVCVPYVCHDNDLETVSLVVTRAAAPLASELVLIETKAHNRYVAVRADRAAIDPEGRPWIRIESEGHGMHPMVAGELPQSEEARVYVRELQTVEASGSARAEQYELASLRDTLWARRHAGASEGRLWAQGETGYLAYNGARHGRRGSWLGASMAGSEYAGGVRPPWGLRASVGERGDWFLDPAYVARMRHPDSLDPSATSLEYAFNPYLADLQAECADSECDTIPPRSSLRPGAASLTGGILAAVFAFSRRARRRAVSGWLRSALRSRAR